MTANQEFRMKSFRYYDMIEQFAKPGCVLCRLLHDDLEKYLSSLLYEFSMELETHAAFRGRRGLCNTHSWMLLQRREGAISLAVLYESAVDEVLKLLDTPNSAGGRLGRLFGAGSGALAEKLAPEQPCVCCLHLTESEKRYIDIVNDGFAHAPFTAAYQEGEGFCLPHLRLVLQAVNTPAHADIVLKHQRAMLTTLKQQLDLYRLRYGLRAVTETGSIEETMGEEATSWRRAIALLAGGEGLFGSDKG
jgi:hypothetical protein